MLTEAPCPRHIIALHVGDRSRERAQQLWAHMPAVYREQAPVQTVPRPCLHPWGLQPTVGD
jgi:hypothetical protein